MEYSIIEDREDLKELKEYLKEIQDYSIKEDGDSIIINTKTQNILVPAVYKAELEEKQQKEDYSNSLIFGKNQLEGIVSIEVWRDKVYILLNDGTYKVKPMVYWILSDEKIDKNFVRLKGDLHYKYVHKIGSHKKFRACVAKYQKMKKDTYQIWNDKESAMIYYGYTMFKGLKVKDVSVLSFDIEAAGLTMDNESEVYLITNTFRNSRGEITKKHFRVDHYNDDKEMIEDWCKWVVEIDPTIITGHNIFSFDIPYLTHCYGQALPIGKKGKPNVSKKKPSEFRVDGNQSWTYTVTNIFGRHVIDGMFLAVKHDIGRKYKSWGLKQIAEQEGLIKEDRQFYDASKIRDNWCDPIEREKIVQYGVDDSDDSLALYDLMIPSLFYMTQSIPKPFQIIGTSSSGAQLNAIMIRAYLQDSHSISKADERDYVAGGMSYGIPGIYDNVVKWDAKSYYPSTILTFDIYDDNKDPNGYFLKMVKHFTYRRFEQKDLYKKTKDEYYNDLQSASKVFANSSYGLLGTSGLNFNSFKNASLITKCCRAGLQKAIIWATGKDVKYWWKEYYDSNTCTQDFENFEFIDKKAELSYEEMPKHNWILTNIDTDALSFCKQDGSSFTDEEYNLIYKELNQIMYSEWEDDGRFEKFLVVKAKNYVYTQDGEVTYKGSSIISPQKEPALREMLNKMIDVILE